MVRKTNVFVFLSALRRRAGLQTVSTLPSIQTAHFVKPRIDFLRNFSNTYSYLSFLFRFKAVRYESSYMSEPFSVESLDKLTRLNQHSTLRQFTFYRPGFLNYSRCRLINGVFAHRKLTPLSGASPFDLIGKVRVRGSAARSKSLDFWLNYHSFLPLQSLFLKKITTINYNILEASNIRNMRKLLKQSLLVFSFLQLNRVAAHFIATIFSALILKDSKALATFIRIIMREIHYKQHNFYFTFVGQLIHDVIKPQLHRFDCLGISVVFRGKLGIGGNARKRALKYHTGVISSSSKYVKLSRSIDIVRTKTGVVGFTVIIAW